MFFELIKDDRWTAIPYKLYDRIFSEIDIGEHQRELSDLLMRLKEVMAPEEFQIELKNLVIFTYGTDHKSEEYYICTHPELSHRSIYHYKQPELYAEEKPVPKGIDSSDYERLYAVAKSIDDAKKKFSYLRAVKGLKSSNGMEHALFAVIDQYLDPSLNPEKRRAIKLDDWSLAGCQADSISGKINLKIKATLNEIQAVFGPEAFDYLTKYIMPHYTGHAKETSSRCENRVDANYLAKVKTLATCEGERCEQLYDRLIALLDTLHRDGEKFNDFSYIDDLFSRYIEQGNDLATISGHGIPDDSPYGCDNYYLAGNYGSIFSPKPVEGLDVLSCQLESSNPNFSLGSTLLLSVPLTAIFTCLFLVGYKYLGINNANAADKRNDDAHAGAQYGRK